MGIGHIGHLLSCNRDGTFIQGYDPIITFERTQTIMGGDCDFSSKKGGRRPEIRRHRMTW